jgi:hypothetical protein
MGRSITMENSGIVAHKQNYLLYTYSDTPSDAPTSLNPLNRVTPTYPYEPQEIMLKKYPAF